MPVPGKKYTNEEVKENFPFKDLPVIHREPTYAVINKMQHTIFQNAAVITTMLGGGKHGHLEMVMKVLSYKTLGTAAYKEPSI